MEMILGTWSAICSVIYLFILVILFVDSGCLERQFGFMKFPTDDV